MEKWGLDAELFLGNAECLPFKDEIFDAVFHVGRVNFFNDRAQRALDLVPPDVLDIDVKELSNGDLYCLTFRKPE